MLDRLRNNLGLKAVSLALAIGAWAYLRFAANPAIAAHFDQQLSVPIVTTGLAPDEIARYPDKQVVVTIVTPRDGLAPVRPDDLRAVLNLADRAPGFYAVPITVIGPRLEVRSVSPSSETLQVERVEGRRVPIAIRYTGEQHAVVVERARVVPDSALIRGPTSDLARVASVRVDVALPAQSQTLLLDAMVHAVASDVHGDEVSGVQVAPNIARILVRFAAPQKGA